MQIKTNVKAGGIGLVLQHNQTAAGIKVQTNVKAGLRYIKRSKTTEAT